MTTILEINPITNGKQTCSLDLQKALSLIGEGKDYDTLKLNAGTYLIDDSVKTCPYSLMGINSGTEIFGETDATGNPLAKLVLQENISTKKLGCDVAIFGPMQDVGENIKIHDFAYDGNCTLTGGKQKNVAASTCPGNHVTGTQETGKSLHNFISAVHASFVNFEMYNFNIGYTAGDIFRTSKWTKSSGIYIHDGTISYAGHAGILLENTVDSVIRDCKIVTRANGAIRLQNYCSGIDIDNICVVGTSLSSNSGLQLTGDNVNVTNCMIYDTYGPGIEYIGLNNNNVNIKNNMFINCGCFPAASKISGVAGILVSGTNALIEDNVFIGCLGSAVCIGIYSPDGTIYTKSGFTVTTRNNKIINTLPALFPGSGSGKHLANLIPASHILVSENNFFYPFKNYSYGSIRWNDGEPEEEAEISDGFTACIDNEEE
jgi:hypothetical protein